MAKLLLLFVICVGLLPVAVQAQENTEFIPGEVWKDTDGNPINAHGGGLLYHNGTYYWYGEYKKGKTVLPEWATWECYRTDVTGVGCYSSKDLLNWKFEGIVLPAVKMTRITICIRPRSWNAQKWFIIKRQVNL